MTLPLTSSATCNDPEVRRHLSQLRTLYRIRQLGISVPKIRNGTSEEAGTSRYLRANTPKPARKSAKISTTIRLSPEVLNAFKATGKGWQTRLNEQLYALVRDGKV